MKKKALLNLLFVILATACRSGQPVVIEQTRTELPTSSPTAAITREEPTEFVTWAATLRLSPAISPTASPTNSPIINPTPTSLVPPTLEGVQIAYIMQDSLYLWRQGQTQRLVTRPDIYDPLLSDDGQWIIYRQRIYLVTQQYLAEEVWAIRPDASDHHRLLGPDDLAALTDEDGKLAIYDIHWVPGRHELLFNTEQIIEGPPGARPTHDLYLLDMAGQVSRLAGAGQGGQFIPSPQGQTIAVWTRSRVGLVDLESGERRTLLDLESIGRAADLYYTSNVRWDTNGRFVMTLILPWKLNQVDYNGEPEQLWRLFLDGTTELIYQRTAYQPHAMSPDPNFTYLLYLDTGCLDAQGMLHVRDLASGADDPRFCVWDVPWWAGDDEHFVFWKDGSWQLGNVFDVTVQPLDFLNVPTDPKVYRLPELTWIDDTHFTVTLRSVNSCTLSIATVEGIVMEIARALLDFCPEVDFIFLKDT